MSRTSVPSSRKKTTALENERLIDALRAFLGLRPLYGEPTIEEPWAWLPRHPYQGNRRAGGGKGPRHASDGDARGLMAGGGAGARFGWR